MDRKQTIEIIATNEYKKVSPEDREAIIVNAWGLDDADEIFHLLSLSLRQELLNFEEPQADTMSPRYDTLVKLLCEYSYSGYSNENLGNMVSNILKKTVIVYGEQPEEYICLCCGEKTLSTRGEYDICSNCGWEDDGIVEEEKYSNPNHMTLKQGRKNYLLHGKWEI